ncbi:Uncharacterized protein FKW44_002769, partial [Caligus rogercresseyi]
MVEWGFTPLRKLELEGKDINYMSTRLANDAAVQEKLDAARISAAKTSPMMGCVNDVIQYLDQESLQPLIPPLVELIKSSVGINTKGVTAHFVISLTTHCPLDMMTFTGKLLAAFVTGLSDRNRTVRKIYAGVIGHLMKTAKDSSVEKLVNKLSNWYLSDNSRLSVAYTFQAINQYNHDVIESHAAKFMPIVFMAMHESAEESSEDSGTTQEDILQIWKDIWNEGTSTSESGIILYLREIVELLSSSMEAQQWKVKSQAAKAMAPSHLPYETSYPMNIGRSYALSYSKALQDIDKKEEKEIEGGEDKAFEENASKKRRVKYEENNPAEPEDKLKLELQRTIFEALGRAWPKNTSSTQKTYILELLELIQAHVESTTIKNLTCL